MSETSLLLRGYEVLETSIHSKEEFPEITEWVDSLHDPRWASWIEQFPIRDSEPCNEIEFDLLNQCTNVYCYARGSHGRKRALDAGKDEENEESKEFQPPFGIQKPKY